MFRPSKKPSSGRSVRTIDQVKKVTVLQADGSDKQQNSVRQEIVINQYRLYT